MDRHFDELIARRLETYWGAGNLRGDIWFVGMEEGHGATDGPLKTRFELTDKDVVVDAFDQSKWFGEGKWIKREKPPIQRTYGKMIYLHLFNRDKIEPDKEKIREFQKTQLGGGTADHAILELMPLPAQSIGHWPYAKSAVKGLATRKEYLATYVPKRIRKLSEMIQRYKPKLVIFYSLSYLPYWKEVAPLDFKEIISKKLYAVKDGDISYMVVPHAVAHGMTNEHWREIALAIQEQLNSRI